MDCIVFFVYLKCCNGATTKTNTTMTTYGGNQRLPRNYNRTAPTKYDYFIALQNAGIIYRLSTPVSALKARCEKEGIQVSK